MRSVKILIPLDDQRQDSLELWIPWIPLPDHWVDRRRNYIYFGRWDLARRLVPTIFFTVWIHWTWLRGKIADGIPRRYQEADVIWKERMEDNG